MDARYEVLGDAAELAREFVDGLPERHVGARATVDELRTRLARPLTEAGEDPRTVIADLADRLSAVPSSAAVRPAVQWSERSCDPHTTQRRRPRLPRVAPSRGRRRPSRLHWPRTPPGHGTA